MGRGRTFLLFPIALTASFAPIRAGADPAGGPPPPVLLSPSDGSTCLETSGTLDWSDVGTADGYRIQIGSSCGLGTEVTVTASQFEYFDLLPGTMYHWRVKSRAADGTFGDYSDCFQFTIAPTLSAPTLQSPLDGATCRAAAGTLDWTAVPGAAAYRVQLGSSCGSGTELEVTSSQYSYSGLDPETTYHWRVQTRDACGHYTAYSACFSFTTASPVPVAPVPQTPPDLVTCLDDSGILDWSDVAGVDEYRVQLSTSCGSGPEYTVSSSQYAFTGLTAGATYYWRVRSRGDCGEYSAYSPCFRMTIAPNPRPSPTLQSPSTGSECAATSGTLNWTDIPGAAAYGVQIGSTCGSGTEITVTSSEYAFADLAAGTYYWRVRTRDSCGQYGPYSSCFHFTTVPPSLAAPTLQSPPDSATCQGSFGFLNWLDVPRATGYRVQLGTSCDTGTEIDAALSQYLYSGLSPSTTYYWRVAVRDSCEQYGSYSSCMSFTTGPQTLAAPALVGPPDSSDCAPLSGTLDWDDVDGAVAYRVRLEVVCGAGLEKEVTASEMPYGELETGRRYFWSVQAVDSCGLVSSDPPCFTFTTTHGELVAPTLLGPPSGTTCAPSSGLLDWSDVDGSPGYRVQIGTSCGSGDEYDVEASTYTYSGLAAGTTYFWRVKSRDGCGILGTYSSCFSLTISAGSATPELQSPSGGDSCQAVSGILDWTDVPAATGYRVQIGTSCQTGPEYDVAKSQYSFAELEPGQDYFWRVRTMDGCGGLGDYSPCLRFSTNLVALAAATGPSPSGEAHCVDRNPVLAWQPVTAASRYHVQVDDSPAFEAALAVDTTVSSASLALPTDLLAEGTLYYWRVQAEGLCGQTATWPDSVWQFKTARPYVIAGRITDPKGMPLADVHFVGAPEDVATDIDGRYELVVPCGWSGTIYPQLGGFGFEPVSRGYSDVAADSENDNYTAAADVTAPGFTVRYLQNTILTNELDLYGVASEVLLPETPHCTVNDAPLATTLTDTSAAVCRAHFRLPASGEYVVCFSGSDPAGNEGADCRTISAAGLLASRGGSLEDHSGAFVLSVPADALVSDAFLTVSEHRGALGGPEARDALTTDALGPESSGWQLGPPGLHFVRPVRVKASARVASTDGVPLSHVAIAVETTAGWTLLATRFDDATGWVEADITETGTYGLVVSDREVATPMEPRTHRIVASSPVPFVREGTFLYDVAAASPVEIVIYDATGRRVRTLVQEQRMAGSYSVEWNGANSAGQPVSGGMYFARMTCGDVTKTARVLLVR